MSVSFSSSRPGNSDADLPLLLKHPDEIFFAAVEQSTKVGDLHQDQADVDLLKGDGPEEGG